MSTNRRQRRGPRPTDELVLDGRPVARVEVADTWTRRARGLLGRRSLPEALWLTPESSVHGMGMWQSLDVALLDGDGHVVASLVLRPCGLTWPRRGVVGVLEAPRGSFTRWGLVAGSTVSRRPAGPHPTEAGPDHTPR
ncbi:MAG TPA: DUF192 domain-containing protein [Pengzhenrongella sp.]